MRKTVLSTLCLLLAIFLLAGCSGCSTTPSSVASEGSEVVQSTAPEAEGEPGEPEKPEKITISCGSVPAPAYEAIAKVYTERYGIEVELIVDSYDNMRNKIITTAASDSSDVDIATLDTVWPAEFLKAGVAYPLNEFVTDEKLAQFVPVTMDQLTVDDQIMGLPFSNESLWLYYNEALLKEGGYDAPPATWEEAITMANDLKDQGLVKYGTAWGASQSEGLICVYAALLKAFDGDWKSGDEWNLNSQNAVDALNFLKDSMENGLADPASVTYNDTVIQNALMSKEVAFVLNWSAAQTVYNEDGSPVKGEIKVSVLPGTEKYSTVSGSTTGGGGLFVFNNSKNKYWAYKFLELMTDLGMQKESIAVCANMPVLEAIYEDTEVLSEYPHLEAQAPQFDHELYRPKLVRYSEWSEVMQRHLHSVLAGSVDAQTALDSAQEEVISLGIE